MAITLEELAKEVQKLKDIEEIKVLKARYSAMCDDNHNWTLIKELFAPDAQWVGRDRKALPVLPDPDGRRSPQGCSRP